MKISTKNINGQDKPVPGGTKREKVLNLVKHHEEMFIKDAARNPKFIPRLAYHHKDALVIGFYLKEIYGGKDIYVEFCDRNYIPEDSARTLWKWKYNANYAKDYELSAPHPSTGDRRYLIPVADLVNVNELHKTIPVVKPVVKPVVEEVKVEIKEDESKLTLDLDSGAGTDIPYSAMSLRDYAAIQWKRPVSQKKWLNELITKQFQI